VCELFFRKPQLGTQWSRVASALAYCEYRRCEYRSRTLIRKTSLETGNFTRISQSKFADYSIIGSGSGFTMNPNPNRIRLTLDTPKSFHLPSESEPRFTVNPDPDPIIEYAFRVIE